jgi:hypothetical protein
VLHRIRFIQRLIKLALLQFKIRCMTQTAKLLGKSILKIMETVLFLDMGT